MPDGFLTGVSIVAEATVTRASEADQEQSEDDE